MFHPKADMRGFVELFFILLIGLGLGGMLSKISIENNLGFGAKTLGQWTAWPDAGSQDADPYTKAKVAAEGGVPLGAAEGIAFHGRVDDKGNPLDLNCSYSITGQTPPARAWTLTAHRIDGETVRTSADDPATLLSRNIIREVDGRFKIQTGPTLAGGNWLETDGEGSFEFVLRLYDTQITSTAGLADPDMPAIVLKGCQS